MFVGARRALLGSRSPSWLPRASVVGASIYVDFANNRYWSQGVQSSFASWMAALGAAFSRGSSATYPNSAGLLATAASGAARFAFNPATGAALGVLLEGTATNTRYSLNSHRGGPRHPRLAIPFSLSSSNLPELAPRRYCPRDGSVAARLSIGVAGGMALASQGTRNLLTLTGRGETPPRP